MTLLRRWLTLAALTTIVAGCSDDDDSTQSADTVVADTAVDVAGDTTAPDDTADTSGDVSDGMDDAGDALDTSPPAPPDQILAFGVDPGQVFSAAPFPNNLYLKDGKVALAPLVDDPRFLALTSEYAANQLDRRIGERGGFGVNGGIFFPVTEPIEMDPVNDKVTMVTLAGPEVGRVIATSSFFYPEGNYLGVTTAMGDYQVAGSTYAVLIETGISTGAGRTVESPAAFQRVLAEVAPDDLSADESAARVIWEPVRAWISEQGKTATDYLIGTIYTGDDVLAYGRKVIAAVDAFQLQPPTRRLAWDVDSEAFIEGTVWEGGQLADYFGVPSGDFAHSPGGWGPSHRENAAFVGDDPNPYTGGVYHANFGRVINGTLAMPALHLRLVDGKADNIGHAFDAEGNLTNEVVELVQFTLYLCDSQLQDLANLPVAVATHGGTGHRSEMVTFANQNCLSGVATIAADIPFHGGRVETMLMADGETLVSTRQDRVNRFTGKVDGDADFVADDHGDDADVIDTGAVFFGQPKNVEANTVESNLLQVSADTYTVLRYLKEGDWSQVQPGLSFDSDHIFHQSLSWGSSFTTMAIALVDDWAGVINASGSGRMLNAALSIAPTNGIFAMGLLRIALALVTPLNRLNEGAWKDPVVGMIDWLIHRGDPSSWAPFILRHRPTDKVMSVLSSGNSWDETLYNGSQVSFNNAFGFPVLTHGDDWTYLDSAPAADFLPPASAYTAPVSANVTYGDTTHSAAVFLAKWSCHSQIVSPTCKQSYEIPHPPITSRESPVIFESPTCALHAQGRAFIDSLLADGATHGAIVAPEGECATLYP